MRTRQLKARHHCCNPNPTKILIKPGPNLTMTLFLTSPKHSSSFTLSFTEIHIFLSFHCSIFSKVNRHYLNQLLILLSFDLGRVPSGSGSQTGVWGFSWVLTGVPGDLKQKRGII